MEPFLLLFLPYFLRLEDDFEEDDAINDAALESFRDDDEEVDTNRSGKFMVYWTTITKTSLKTAYTLTSTIATVMCTPSGFTQFSACGKK